MLIPPVPGRPLIMYMTVLDELMECVLGQHDCRNLPFGGRATRDSLDACSTKGIRAESPPTFI